MIGLLLWISLPFVIGAIVAVVVLLQRFVRWVEEREAARRFDRDFIAENADVVQVQARFDDLVEVARARAEAIRDAGEALTEVQELLASADEVLLLLAIAESQEAAA